MNKLAFRLGTKYVVKDLFTLIAVGSWTCHDELLGTYVTYKGKYLLV